MSLFKLRLFELISTFLIGVLTLIFEPSLPLLAIPFLMIISQRSIMITLTDEDFKRRQINQEGKTNGKS